jgi:hypothetical protein
MPGQGVTNPKFATIYEACFREQFCISCVHCEHLYHLHIRSIGRVMQEASTSKTSVNFYQATRRNSLVCSRLHACRRENLKDLLVKLLLGGCISQLSGIRSPSLIALMIGEASTRETSANFYQTIRRSNPEDSHLHICDLTKLAFLAYVHV